MPSKKTTKAKSPATKARLVKSKLAVSGQSTRQKAHLVSANKRQQAKRDKK